LPVIMPPQEEPPNKELPRYRSAVMLTYLLDDPFNMFCADCRSKGNLRGSACCRYVRAHLSTTRAQAFSGRRGIWVSSCVLTAQRCIVLSARTSATVCLARHRTLSAPSLAHVCASASNQSN